MRANKTRRAAATPSSGFRLVYLTRWAATIPSSAVVLADLIQAAPTPSSVRQLALITTKASLMFSSDIAQAIATGTVTPTLFLARSAGYRILMKATTLLSAILPMAQLV